MRGAPEVVEERNLEDQQKDATEQTSWYVHARDKDWDYYGDSFLQFLSYFAISVYLVNEQYDGAMSPNERKQRAHAHVNA